MVGHRQNRHKHVINKLLLAPAIFAILWAMLSLIVWARTSTEWLLTGSLHNAREYHTATLLRDGRVLVVGGEGNPSGSEGVAPSLTDAELYDARTGMWTHTGSLHDARQYQAASILPDGHVLVVGGRRSSTGMASDDLYLASAELYDPRTNIWTMTGRMHQARSGATATLLPGGQVLVVGGEGQVGNARMRALASAEVYDPHTGIWTETGRMQVARNGATATLLSDGRVLVTGGFDRRGHELATAELFDPSYGTWGWTQSLHDAHALHTATLLRDGTVLVVGGEGMRTMLQAVRLYRRGHWILHRSLIAGQVPIGLASAEIYDPRRSLWMRAGSLSGCGRFYHTATLLLNGRVLIAGGSAMEYFPDGDKIVATLDSAEVYDPRLKGWREIERMYEVPVGEGDVRRGHTATLLPDGDVLVAGGGFTGEYGRNLSSAEIYDPSAPLLAPSPLPT